MAARCGAGGGDAVKVCFIASPGGHLTQMRRLRDVYARHDSFIVTHRAAHRPDLSGFQRVYYVAEPGGGRWRRNPLLIAAALVQLLLIFARERPRVVISTGAGIAGPGFVAARLFRAATIYIEAGSRITTLSRAGRFCYRIADLFMVQSPALCEKYPRAVYRGALYRHILE
ncbi:UDP-N-acetylglucosamine--LPS N-acetylglucosamine transferase [bacterium]|nr:UDP-N-acetylglucosamine--LPS N-acetylglucosamine transferase [bacterium]